MSPIQDYLRHALKDIRADLKYEGIELVSVTESGVDPDDVFAVPSTITTSSTFFSGSLAWGRTIQNEDQASGTYKKADCTIVASLDEKDNIDAENAYLIVSGIELRPMNIQDSIDTNEIVISCERITK